MYRDGFKTKLDRFIVLLKAFYFLKCLLTYLGGRESARASAPTYWLTPQMSTEAEAGPGRGLELETPPGLPRERQEPAASEGVRPQKLGLGAGDQAQAPHQGCRSSNRHLAAGKTAAPPA